MRLAPTVLTLLTLAAVHVHAAPFDMSVERAEQGIVETKQASEPAPVAVPALEALVPARLRYLAPLERLSLEGEIASRSWSIYLTPSQAAAAQALNYGYRNAIFVAPEDSRIAVYVNDTLISEQPVQSPERISERSVELPRGLLQPGANTISVRVIQQHRTDCTIESTYQLWTEIIPEKTYLALDPAAPEAARTIDDVKAVGVDMTGRTRFKIVVPDLGPQGETNAVMRLSQSLALLGHMPNQSFDVSDTIGREDGPGEMTVLVGTASTLAEIMPDLPDAARTAAFAGFLPEPKTGRQILVISGPTRAAIEAAVETMATALDRPETIQREMLATQALTGAETPLLRAGTRLSFARLGVATTEFSGRRFRTGFDIGVPADFYAGAYGEAQILLDAAYSDQILPGSHIDVYVNGNIASTVPITSTSGGILRHLPIRVTMRHFKPGANRVEIEAVLRARSDEACVPGTQASAQPRFALFNSSELHMPDFARIAQLPNLSAAAGTAFPYGPERQPIALFLDRTDSQTLSVAATFLGKLAVAAGRPMMVRAESSSVRIGDGNAIFIGAISQIPPMALERTHVAEAARNAWGNREATLASGADNSEAFDQWRDRVSGGSWIGQVSALERWMKQTFDISFGSLQFLPTDEESTLPPNTASFLVAQGLSPEGTGAWTVLAAPNDGDLRGGMEFMSDAQNWAALDGRIVMVDKVRKSTLSLPATRTQLLETQPFSLSNYRLIAANWLSTNILSYAALFGGSSLLLGLATSAVLNTFGRKK